MLLAGACAPPEGADGAAPPDGTPAAPDPPAQDPGAQDPAGDEPAGDPAPGAGSDEAVSPAASASPAPDLTSAPTVPPEGEEVAFDAAADYGDGLVLQVNEVRALQAPPGVTGAEGTDGMMVEAEVMVTNNSGSEFASQDVVVQGYYRGFVGAPMVHDPSGQLGVGFDEAVPDGGSLRTRVAFAVPAPDLGDVTVRVDPADGNHGAILFRGAVEQE